MSDGEFSSAEADSLPIHVTSCRHRHAAMLASLQRGEKRMGRIERMLWGVIGFLIVVNIPAAKELLGYLP